jgi:hypothetical protein
MITMSPGRNVGKISQWTQYAFLESAGFALSLLRTEMWRISHSCSIKGAIVKINGRAAPLGPFSWCPRLEENRHG